MNPELSQSPTMLQSISWIRFCSIVISVACLVFCFLWWLQIDQGSAPIQGGTIRPNATAKQVSDYIKQLPEVPYFSGGDVVAVTGDISGSGQDLIDLDDLMSELLVVGTGTTHQAGDDNYDTKLQSLCQMYQSVCAITQLDGSYSPQQKFNYQLMVVYLTTKLKKFGLDPIDSLVSLTINNYTKQKRGYANANLMVLNVYQMSSNKEFLQVLTHEMGHVIDLGVIVGTSSQINPDYTEFHEARFAVDDQSLPFYAISWINEDTMRSSMSDTDFVSGYGMSNPFEDFAECHNMYLYHREVFAYMASTSKTLKRKYDYFNQLYQSQYLSDNFNPTDLTRLSVDYRPWDTTRM